MKETIYNVCHEKVENGSRFRIDLERRDLVVDGKYIIRDGVPADKDMELAPRMDGDQAVELLETLYLDYRHSVPSERSRSQRRRYFRALPEHELEMEDMMYGQPREMCRYRLEAFILLHSMDGGLRWDMLGRPEHWFWQSPRHPQLVILRRWIDGKGSKNQTNL